MPNRILFERSGLVITAKGDFSNEELRILEHEVKATILDILKYRKFGGGSR